MKLSPILRCASWMVPGDQREEWLAEWGGEAAYVRHTRGRARSTAFCLGAFRDALWLRRNQAPAPAIFSLDSPLRCIVVLAILAAASVSFGVWSTHESASVWPSIYRDAGKLAMISHHRGRAPQFAEIPVEEYRLSAKQKHAGVEEVAFYKTKAVWFGRNRFVLGLASPNLYKVLGAQMPTHGLALSSEAWRRSFKGDPHLVGSIIEVAGVRAEVTSIISGGPWQLPGFVDAWLLDESRLEALPPEAEGFMVARLQTAPPWPNFRWRMSTPNDRETFDTLGAAPVPHENPIFPILMIFGGAILLLSATTSLSLGDYPASRFSPRGAWVRRWLFLAVKLALLLPVLVCGLFGMATVFPPSLQGWLLYVLLALRWALNDQRRRCPVCLRYLSHPVRIGEASHTFLGWYGTELVCTRGHGLLHVPEIRTSCYAEQRWLYLDPSWTS
jgi:hypothetical protein